MKISRESGFSLVEVTMALGILTFALMVLLALLPVGLNTVQKSAQESAATNVLHAVAADIRNVPTGEQTSSLYGIPVWNASGSTSGDFFLDENGNRAAAGTASNYSVYWTVRRPSAPATVPVHVHLEVAWPGDTPTPRGSIETLVTLSRHQ
jgi:uncharacterized protein (TIGR02598 family)